MTQADHLARLTPDTRVNVEHLLTFARSRGLNPRIVSSKRSCEEQAELFAKGRETAGPKVTWVNGCRSWHVHGRAADVYVGTWEPSAYYELGEFWRRLGGKWGGDFGDYVHFEWHPSLKISDVCPDPAGACPAGSTALSMVGKALALGGAAVIVYVVVTRKSG
jgi:hypothetical protein